MLTLCSAYTRTFSPGHFYCKNKSLKIFQNSFSTSHHSLRFQVSLLCRIPALLGVFLISFVVVCLVTYHIALYGISARSVVDEEMRGLVKIIEYNGDIKLTCGVRE